jgi:hypothetical protein
MKMASIISFSVFELFTFISFFFSIASLIILSYILIRRRNILTAAKKRSIQKSQIKSSQIEIKLNDMLQKKDKEIIELKHFLQKYMDIESVFLKEIQSFEPKSEVDYPSFIEKLKTQIIEMNNFGKNFTDKLKNSNQETEKYLFSQVLKKKHPFLTDQEIGLCTYFRMNTPSKEIAVLEGITDGTVRVYKNKIKNKIGLSQMDSLNEYLVNIPLKKTA